MFRSTGRKSLILAVAFVATSANLIAQEDVKEKETETTVHENGDLTIVRKTTIPQKPAALYRDAQLERKAERLRQLINITVKSDSLSFNKTHWEQFSKGLPEDAMTKRNREMMQQIQGRAGGRARAGSPAAAKEGVALPKLMGHVLEGEQITSRTSGMIGLSTRPVRIGMGTKGLNLSVVVSPDETEVEVRTDNADVQVRQTKRAFSISVQKNNGDMILLINNSKWHIVQIVGLDSKSMSDHSIYNLFKRDPRFVRGCLAGLSNLGVGGPFINMFDKDMRQQVVGSLRPKIKSNLDFVELMASLGSDSFKEREAASRNLRQHGNEFEDRITKEAINEDNDIELRNRLTRVLNELDAQKTASKQFVETLANDADYLAFARESADDSEKVLIDAQVKTLADKESGVDQLP